MFIENPKNKDSSLQNIFFFISLFLYFLTANAHALAYISRFFFEGRGTYKYICVRSLGFVYLFSF